jgi:hypothetical protein
MGQKRNADDYQQTAEENGWVLGVHEEEDSIEQTKDGLATGKNIASRRPLASG